MTQRIAAMIRSRPELIFVFTVLFLGLSYLGIYFIDVLNVFGLRDRFYTDRDASFFFFYWFFQPIERPLQWVGLMGSMYICFLNLRIARCRSELRLLRFWRLMGMGVFFLVLEDILDIRHVIRLFAAEMLGQEGYGVIPTLLELSYFALLGGILLYAFLRYRDLFWQHDTPRRFFVVGYICYGAAALSSWLGSAFESELDDDIYTITGRWITEPLFRLDDDAARLFEKTNAYLASIEQYSLEHFFMDGVFEESLELLGAAALLVAGISFFNMYREANSESTSEP